MPGCQYHGNALDEQDVYLADMQEAVCCSIPGSKIRKTYKDKAEKTPNQIKMRNSCGDDFAALQNRSF